MTFILGVDAGNSKTIALVSRLDGTIIGAGRGGCGDIYDSLGAYGKLSATDTANAALSAVDDAVQAALRQAGVNVGNLMAGAFSMAGADWPEDIAFLRKALLARGYGRSVIVVNDAIGALYAGAPAGPAVAVTCGTGAAIGARGADGRVWHTSHWQEPHGSNDLARKTLRAVYRAELGIDPPSSLTSRVPAYFGRTCVEEVLHLFTAREGTPPREVGKLAAVLLDEAGASDRTARRIVQEHGAALGDYALVAVRKVGLSGSPFVLVLAGGVMRHRSGLLAEAIVARVRVVVPAVQPLNSRFEPVVGALFLALEAIGVHVDDHLQEQLAPTLPPAALFAT